MITHISVKNNQRALISEIPVLPYAVFMEFNTALLKEETHHCVNYFGVKHASGLKLYCCIANDTNSEIYISSAEIDPGPIKIPSFSARHLAFQGFERELHENFNVNYTDHPWLKPLRYAHNRANLDNTIGNYPFYQIESEELHEVGVGPIHAGIIEPGHFRFICNGEQILHLEIQLGYQHRGVEQLFLSKPKLLQRNILAESIAGDTVVGHTTAFANAWESLCGFEATNDMMIARTIALELERIAIHTGDLSAICTDIAYQLGSSVFGRLRTPIINSFQVWCGNRLAKSLIRAGDNPYPITPEIRNSLLAVFEAFEPDFIEMYNRVKNLPSALARLEKTGVVTKEQALSIGAVGMTAKASGISRDIRSSHPHDYYGHLAHQPIIKRHGDVYSRTQLRNQEVLQSLVYIRKMIDSLPSTIEPAGELASPHPNSIVVSLVEGWRGEICHCALTGDNGKLVHYKIKDPSFHNWMALALSVRNNEISDFPICNKSFNLSYCGHDL